jgi:hypothetical protein
MVNATAEDGLAQLRLGTLDYGDLEIHDLRSFPDDFTQKKRPLVMSFL